jgi:hypothetical protein
MADAGLSSKPVALDCYIECPTPILIALKARITGEFYEGDSQDPTNIVKCGSSCYCTVRIDFTGSQLARLLCLKWCVKVAFESCGPGGEYAVGVKNIEQQVCKQPYVEVEIPVTFTKCDPCGTVYVMCLTATAQDMCDKPAPFGGYCRGEQIMVYPAS